MFASCSLAAHRLAVDPGPGGVDPLGDRWLTVDEPQSQLWLRADARSPWIVDIPLTPDVDGLWSNKRLPAHIAPVEEVTWRAPDGILYLKPEIVLTYKATSRRAKDDLDFEATLPSWMRSAPCMYRGSS